MSKTNEHEVKWNYETEDGTPALVTVPTISKTCPLCEGTGKTIQFEHEQASPKQRKRYPAQLPCEVCNGAGKYCIPDESTDIGKAYARFLSNRSWSSAKL